MFTPSRASILTQTRRGVSPGVDLRGLPAVFCAELEGPIRPVHEAVLDLSEARLLRAARADEPGARGRLWATTVDSLWSIAAANLPKRAARSAVLQVRGRFDGLIAAASLGRPWREGVHAALWEAITQRASEPPPGRGAWRLRTPEQVHRRVVRAVQQAPPLHRMIWTFALLGDAPAEHIARWSGLDEQQVRARRSELAWRVACAMRGGTAEHDAGLTPLVCALFGDLSMDSLQLWSDRIDGDPELRALSAALSTAADACRAAQSEVAPESLGWEAGLGAEAPSGRRWLLLIPAAIALAVGLGIGLADTPTRPAVESELAEAHVDRVFNHEVRAFDGWQDGADRAALEQHLLRHGVVSRVARRATFPKDSKLLGAAPLPGGGAVWLLRARAGEELALHLLHPPPEDPDGRRLARDGAPTLTLSARGPIQAVFWTDEGLGVALALRGDPDRALHLAKELAWGESQ